MSDEPLEETLPDEQPGEPPAISPRLAGYLCPPVGMWLHWRAHKAGLGEKIFSTLGLLAYSILYLIVGVWGLKAVGMVVVDWPGYGFPPGLAWEAPTLSASDWEKSTAAIDANASAHWPDFRGARRDGIYDSGSIRTDWNQSPPRLLWKTTVGKGHSSLTIAQGLVFTQEQRQEGEVVSAYNAADGKGVWNHVQGGEFVGSYGMGGIGPRSTPTWDEGRLYALGSAGYLTCHNATTGTVVWEKNIHTEFGTVNLMFGMCAAPLVVGDRLFITAGKKGRGKTPTVIALDKATGETAWAQSHGTQAYMSPMVLELAGQKQLILTSAMEALGLSLENGKELWSHRWSVSHGNNIAQPIGVSTNQLFLSAGYQKGSALLEISTDGETFSAKQIESSTSLKNKFTSSVLHQGHIYGLDDQDDKRAVLVCLEVATLREKWRGDDYGHGQLLLANGHLVILSENGEIALVKAAPDSFQQIACLPALTGKTWNHPALAGGRLYIRNGSEMACYDISVGSTGGSAPALFNTSQTVQVIAAGMALMLLLGGGVLWAITMSRKSAAVPRSA